MSAPEPDTEGPERDLAEALRRTEFTVEPDPFALIGFLGPPDAEDLGLIATQPAAQLVRDAGESTLLVPARLAAAVADRHPGAKVEQPLRWIRFHLAMDWELVGFLAEVTGRLARAGVPIGAVCGYSRDHLFVAEAHLETAQAVLQGFLRERPVDA